MTVKSGVQNYINTIIFCVVMKIVSIIVLGMIMLNKMSDSIVYLLSTIEIGIVFIVIASLYSISSYEKRIAEEARNLLKSKINVISCPDFYTRDEDGVCVNNYTTADGKIEYRINDAPPVVLSDYMNKDIGTICSTYNTGFGPSSAPWTDISTKCDVI